MNDKDFSLDVSIIIVNYNTKQLLSDCLTSIYEQTKGIDFEVIVSDNGSKDGSIEMLKADFPQVILIENNANLGFGAANNRGLAIAKGKYIFYLNSDTILLNNAVKIFFDYWEENGEKENIGSLGANLLSANNEIIHSYGNFLNLTDIDKMLSNIAHTVYGNLKLFFLHKFFHQKIPSIEKNRHTQKKWDKSNILPEPTSFSKMTNLHALMKTILCIAKKWICSMNYQRGKNFGFLFRGLTSFILKVAAQPENRCRTTRSKFFPHPLAHESSVFFEEKWYTACKNYIVENFDYSSLA